MTGDQIHYEQLAQDALRGVIREVLMRAEQNGLPGDHHFYIAFDTQADGVSISKRLKEQYPVEMTVVLQHQFWDLKVTDTHFEIKLSFNNVPETLIVPFSAIKVFFDPSVPYGLQFGAAAEIAHDDTHSVLTMPDIIGENEETSSVLPRWSVAPENTTASSKADDDTGADDDGSSDDKERPSAEVVELDHFRKK